MKPQLTSAIVLKRTNFGEADRIITFLTPDHGKLRLMARGVRKAKSKLAGGIELFSTTHISYLSGRGEIGTLISTRLLKYYDTIVQDIDRVQLGYEIIKTLDRATEDHPEPEYYQLLESSFLALDTPEITQELVRMWFQAQLLRLAGHSPNLATDTSGKKLTSDQTYIFDFDAVAFEPNPQGNFPADHIKLLRLSFSRSPPKTLSQIKGLQDLLPVCAPLIHTLLQQHIRL